MSYNALYYVSAALFGSWIVLLVQWIRTANELKLLKQTQARGGIAAHGAVEALQTFSKVGHINLPSVPYPDTDGDGTPDAFQRRRPLSEMLEFEKPPGNHSNDYWVAIELPARSPKKGEYCLVGTMIIQAGHDFSSSSDFIIVKSVPGTNLDDLVDLTK